MEAAYTCPDHLYIIRDEWTEALKVGRSLDPASRVTQLQTGCPGTLTLVHVVRHGGFLEGAIRTALDPFVLRGEWFDSLSPLAQFVEEDDVEVSLPEAYKRLTDVFMDAALTIQGDGASKSRRLHLHALAYRMWGTRWCWVAEQLEKRAWEVDGVLDDEATDGGGFPMNRWITAAKPEHSVWYAEATWADHQAYRAYQVAHLSRTNRAFEAEEERREQLRTAGMADDPTMTTERAVRLLDPTAVAAD